VGVTGCTLAKWRNISTSETRDFKCRTQGIKVMHPILLQGKAVRAE